MNTSATTSPAPVAATTGPKSAAARALIIGVAGIVVGLFGLFHAFTTHDSRPVFGWLIGWAFWFSMFTGVLYLVIFKMCIRDRRGTRRKAARIIRRRSSGA